MLGHSAQANGVIASRWTTSHGRRQEAPVQQGAMFVHRQLTRFISTLQRHCERKMNIIGRTHSIRPSLAAVYRPVSVIATLSRV